MKKKIEDYLCYYIGQEVEVNGKRGIISGRNDKWALVSLDGKEGNNQECNYDYCKILLRPLSDMTVPEATEMKSLMGRQTDGVHPVYILVHSPYSFSYLLKQGFDLFGLIEAGLAMDKTKEVRNAN